MTKIAIIVGSTRQNRMTDKLATWVHKEVVGKAEAEILDLRDYPMPFFDEAISPRYNPQRQAEPEVQKWLDRVAEFDGFVAVTPEYNRTTTAVLKNAIDVLDFQMEHKPVAIVAHGSSGGAQAVASLRMALPGVGAVTVPQALFFTDQVGDAIDDDGILKAELADNPYGHQANLVTLTDTLVAFANALSPLRRK